MDAELATLHAKLADLQAKLEEAPVTPLSFNYFCWA